MTMLLKVVPKTMLRLHKYRWHLMAICWMVILGGTAWYNPAIRQICAEQFAVTASCLQLPPITAESVIRDLVTWGILYRAMWGAGTEWYRVTLYSSTLVLGFLDAFRGFVRLFIRRQDK